MEKFHLSRSEISSIVRQAYKALFTAPRCTKERCGGGTPPNRSRAQWRENKRRKSRSAANWSQVNLITTMQTGIKLNILSRSRFLPESSEWPTLYNNLITFLMTNYGQISHKRGVRTLSNSHKRATIIDNLFVMRPGCCCWRGAPALYTQLLLQRYTFLHLIWYNGIAFSLSHRSYSFLKQQRRRGAFTSLREEREREEW